MTANTRPRGAVIVPLAALVAVLALTPAEAAKRKRCNRGGATVVALEGNVQVVKRSVSGRTRWEGCWAKTGKRFRVAGGHSESDASATFDIQGGRYLGVLEFIATGTADETQARIYDTSTGKLLHDSNTCFEGQPGQLEVTEAVFLRNGGMAVACDRLIVFRTSASDATQLEPAGANARGLAASRDGRVVYWLAGPNPGTAKSATID